MIDWLIFSPTVAIAIALVLIPGLLVGAALRIRGMLLWGFAPAAGVAALAVSAVALGALGIPWAPWSAAVAVLFLAAVAGVIGFVSRTRLAAPTLVRPAPIIASIIAGSLFGIFRAAALIRDPQNLSQTNDAIFHLSALRFIQESADASSLDLLGVIGSSGFYPAAWHAVASLVMEFSGTDVVESANATSLVIAGPIWVLSMTSFVWSLTRGSRFVTAAAALMSSALYAFPFDMLDFGVLYPYALALAVLPGVLALIVPADSDPGSGRRQPLAGPTFWLTMTASAVGLVALGLAQPSAVLLWVIGASCVALSSSLRGWKKSTGSERARYVVRILTILLVSAGVWIAVTRLSSSTLWAPTMPAYSAAAELLLNNATDAGPAIMMSVLALIGVFTVVRIVRLRWFALFAAAIALLAVVALSVQNPVIRGVIAAWYADPHRFVAMMPLVVIPLAAIGTGAIVSALKRRSSAASRATAAVLVTAVIVETIGWTGVAMMHEKSSYTSSAQSYLSTDERTLLDALSDTVRPGSRVVGNPSTGAAFGYALSGVDVVPRTWAMPDDADFQQLRVGLVDVATDPGVCTAVASLGIDYVLDFGKSAEGAGKWDMPGMTGFEEHPGFRLVAERGDASLWRIEECGTE